MRWNGRGAANPVTHKEGDERKGSTHFGRSAGDERRISTGAGNRWKYDAIEAMKARSRT
jgi:hypothetical protein